MHCLRGPTSCVGRKVTSPLLRGRGGSDLAGVEARGMRAGGFPGNPGGLVVSILKTAGARAPAHQARGRGRRTWRPTERTAGARMVPPGEGNEARGDGRRGVGVSHSTAEAGELSPRDPVGGKGAPAGGTVGGKDGQHTEVGSRLHATTDSRTGQTRPGDGGILDQRVPTARSEAVCRGAGCGSRSSRQG